MSPSTRPWSRLALLAGAVGLVLGCGRGNADGVHIYLKAEATPTPAARIVAAALAPTANAPATASAPRSLAPDATVAPRPRLTATPAPTVAAAALEYEDPKLLAVIRAALGSDAERASVVVKRLTDGAVARHSPSQVYYAASLYKLAVLYEAFRQRERGQIDFHQRAPLTSKYTAEDLGTIAQLPLDAAGTIALEDAVRAMVTKSDNASATLLLDVLGHRQIDATLERLGLRDTSVNTTELPTTAADMARLLEAIVRGEGLRPYSATEMTALLLAQETRAGIPRGLPAGVPVGNKTGTWPGATHDVAVVYAPTGTYVIAVLTEHSWAWEPITRVSRAVHDYWQSAGAPAKR